MSNGILILLVVLACLLIVFVLSKISGSSVGENAIRSSDQEDGVQGRVLRDLKFIRSVLSKLAITSDRRSVLHAQLDRLEIRARRCALHLAVIGEFNSGKSTFINALLQQRLLKSANIATTASATEIRQGRQLALSVRFTDGSTLAGSESDCLTLASRFEKFRDPRDAGLNLRQLIDLVTSHPEASRLVDAIEIVVPNEWLRRGICILDTPGVGAGPDHAAHHQAVTERVLAEQADSAVVLIPADCGVSRTLLDFLDSVVRPFLSRCIFVITKLDNVSDPERAEIVSHVNHLLSNFLGTTPVILEAGALTVLLPSDSDPERESARTYWRSEFTKLQESLFDAMSRQGPIIVAEALTRLLHQAIGDLNTEISARQEQLDKEERTLASNSVMRIEQVLNRLRSQGQGAMNETLMRVESEMELAASRFETQAKQKVNAVLDATAWRNLKETIQETIPASVSEEEKEFTKELGVSFTQLDRQCTESYVVFTTEFEKCYKSLKSLGIPQLQTSVAAVPRSQPLVTDLMKATPFTSGPRWRDFVGIIINKEKKRQELRSMLFPVITHHVEAITAHWRHRLGVAAAAMRSELDRAVQVHLRQYTATVNEMIREHERRRSALRNEQIEIQGFANELQSRAQQLKNWRQTLPGR